MNYKESISTVKRIQDKVLSILTYRSDGMPRSELVQMVQESGVFLERGEDWEDQFRLALTALKIRGLLRTLSASRVQLMKQF